MRIFSLFPRVARGRARGQARPITAVARLDRHTRRLATRLAPGEIAVVDHLDLDAVSAEALVAAGAVAVLNASPSSSGRYPTQGARVLLRAGVPLIDDCGDGLYQRLRDGDRVSVDGDTVLLDGVMMARGVRQDRVRVATTMSAATGGAQVQVGSFVASVRDVFAADAGLLLRGEGIPSIDIPIAGRPCVVVARGHGYRADLARLRSFLRVHRPVLIGVDGGADALLAAGLRPHVIVGDLDAVSERALRCGAQLVARLSPDNRAYGAARLAALNLAWVGFPATLAAEELGVLLADAHGAGLVVTAGIGVTLPALLDRGRAGTASSLLTRVCLSGRVVHAQAAAALHRPTISTRAFAGGLAAAMGVMAAAVWFGSAGRPVWDVVGQAVTGLLP